jgi:HJR/Mrr/RecB family endonuclease
MVDIKILMGIKIMGLIIIIFLVFLSISVLIFFYTSKKTIKTIKNKKINKFINGITIDSINSLSGQDFEEFLYYLFLNLGFDVTKTKSSHDYGADLILKINNIIITIQSKLYHNHSVGTSSVQEVYSSTKYYNANLGIVITNSYFTKSAKNLAKSTNVMLWDRDFLKQLLSLKEYEKRTFKNKLLYSILNEN